MLWMCVRRGYLLSLGLSFPTTTGGRVCAYVRVRVRGVFEGIVT